MKKCFKCNNEKPLSEFYKHRAMDDGHLNKCKDCTKQDVRRNRGKNITYYRAYDVHRAKTISRRLAKLAYQKTYRAQQKEKYVARTAIGNAIRDKKILRQPCEVCGEKKTHAHHHDYSQPLTVRWLCVEHHFNEHRRSF
jgi:hypothetical protein